MYIKNKCSKVVGDFVITTRKLSSLSGTFTKGSEVKIIGIDPMRGYSIEDKEGNRMYECGWGL